jgi:hypothetical protein
MFLEAAQVLRRFRRRFMYISIGHDESIGWSLPGIYLDSFQKINNHGTTVMVSKVLLVTWENK